MMQAQFMSLFSQQKRLNTELTVLWTEVKDLSAQMSFHRIELNKLEHRLCDADKSLTGPSIREIASGTHNRSLRKFVLCMIFQRNKLLVRIETEKIILGNFSDRYIAVLKDHDKLCRKANVIGQKLDKIAREITYETRMSWINTYNDNFL